MTLEFEHARHLQKQCKSRDRHWDDCEHENQQRTFASLSCLGTFDASLHDVCPLPWHAVSLDPWNNLGNKQEGRKGAGSALPHFLGAAAGQPMKWRGKWTLAGGSVETRSWRLSFLGLASTLHHERLQDGGINAFMCQHAPWQNVVIRSADAIEGLRHVTAHACSRFRSYDESPSAQFIQTLQAPGDQEWVA